MLRIIFGPMRGEVIGVWRKLHNEELNDLYSSTIIFRVIKSKRIRWAEHVACMGESRGVCRILVGKPEGKRPLGKPRRRWEDNNKMDLQEVGCCRHGLDRSDPGYGQVEGTCECGNGPSGSIKRGKFLGKLRNG